MRYGRPSKFCADGMKKYGIDNIHIIPHIIDPERFNPAKTEPLKEPLSRDAFRFLSIMGWSERKGVSDLIRAYLKNLKKTMCCILKLIITILKSSSRSCKYKKENKEADKKTSFTLF